MRFSVVIPTCNRAASLRKTLTSLRYQTWEAFELIVVNGPSKDETEAVLREFGLDIRTASNAEPNLNISRNIGIAMAAGDIVAFTDDDAIPDPYWLEELARGYDSPEIAGAGGIVYDPSGYRLQPYHFIADRLGRTPGVTPAHVWGEMMRRADAFDHLMGCNCSYLRDRLVETGGFDEQIPYYLDETELCLRLAERGYRLRALGNAAVYHKFMPGHVRNEKKVLRHPFLVVKHQFYFALKSRRAGQSADEVIAHCNAFADQLLLGARRARLMGGLTRAELMEFEREVENGKETGLQLGLHGSRRSAKLPPPSPDSFRQFPTMQPQEPRVNICFVSGEILPDTPRGIEDSTLELAQKLAAEGHEVHFLMPTRSHTAVDFESGVWVHQVYPDRTGPWVSPRLPSLVQKHLAHASAVHREIVRLERFRKCDELVVPHQGSAGLFCLLDDRVTSVLPIEAVRTNMSDGHKTTSRDSGELRLLLSVWAEAVRAARHLRRVKRMDFSNGSGPEAIELVRQLKQEVASRRADPLNGGPVPMPALVALSNAASQANDAPPTVSPSFMGRWPWPLRPLGRGLANCLLWLKSYLIGSQRGFNRALLLAVWALAEEQRAAGGPGKLRGLLEAVEDLKGRCAALEARLAALEAKAPDGPGKS
jgi:GT2 family glycosyltransferase